MVDGLVDLGGVPVQRRSEFFVVGPLRDTTEYDGDNKRHRQPNRYADQNPNHTSFVALGPVKSWRNGLGECCNTVLE